MSISLINADCFESELKMVNEKILDLVKDYDISFKWIPEYAPDVLFEEPVVKITLRSREEQRLHADVYLLPIALKEETGLDVLYLALCHLEQQMKKERSEL